MTPLNPFTRPFLKWPGGKYRLVPILQSILPNRPILVEPFVGAGALFMNAIQTQVILNDINPDLINLYETLQKRSYFIAEAKKFFTSKNNQPKIYYQLRKQFNESQDKLERAYLFLYLNRHGYNGLCRYNLQGYFNVPFGDYLCPYFPQEELERFCTRAQKMSFSCQNFSVMLRSFLRKSTLAQYVFYCDPPYAPLSPTSNFTGYSAHKFTLQDQEILAHLAQNLMKKGAAVVISNHDTPFTRALYQDALIEEIKVSRTISCKTQNRKKAAEIIACYFP